MQVRSALLPSALALALAALSSVAFGADTDIMAQTLLEADALQALAGAGAEVPCEVKPTDKGAFSLNCSGDKVEIDYPIVAEWDLPFYAGDYNFSTKTSSMIVSMGLANGDIKKPWDGRPASEFRQFEKTTVRPAALPKLVISYVSSPSYTATESTGHGVSIPLEIPGISKFVGGGSVQVFHSKETTTTKGLGLNIKELKFVIEPSDLMNKIAAVLFTAKRRKVDGTDSMKQLQTIYNFLANRAAFKDGDLYNVKDQTIAPLSIAQYAKVLGPFVSAIVKYLDSIAKEIFFEYQNKILNPPEDEKCTAFSACVPVSQIMHFLQLWYFTGGHDGASVYIPSLEEINNKATPMKDQHGLTLFFYQLTQYRRDKIDFFNRVGARGQTTSQIDRCFASELSYFLSLFVSRLVRAVEDGSLRKQLNAEISAAERKDWVNDSSSVSGIAAFLPWFLSLPSDPLIKKERQMLANKRFGRVLAGYMDPKFDVRIPDESISAERGAYVWPLFQQILLEKCGWLSGTFGQRYSSYHNIGDRYLKFIASCHPAVDYDYAQKRCAAERMLMPEVDFSESRKAATSAQLQLAMSKLGYPEKMYFYNARVPDGETKYVRAIVGARKEFPDVSPKTGIQYQFEEKTIYADKRETREWGESFLVPDEYAKLKAFLKKYKDPRAFIACRHQFHEILELKDVGRFHRILLDRWVTKRQAGEVCREIGMWLPAKEHLKKIEEKWKQKEPTDEMRTIALFFQESKSRDVDFTGLFPRGRYDGIWVAPDVPEEMDGPETDRGVKSKVIVQIPQRLSLYMKLSEDGENRFILNRSSYDVAPTNTVICAEPATK